MPKAPALSPGQWKTLLTNWSTQLLTTDLTEHLDPADRHRKYLGFPPASASAIDALERRLKISLPPSYRAFLKSSDGFRVISPFTYRLRSAANVDWFRVENQAWIEIYNEPTPYDDPDYIEPPDKEYFYYAAPNEIIFRRSHLFAMLQISDDCDGVMLLNPLAVTPDGEWEAWFFANWIPGARRYASFAHMMVETYRSLRQLEKLPNKPKLPTIEIPGPEIPRHAVVEPAKPYHPRHADSKRKKGESVLELVAEFMTPKPEQIAAAPLELVKLLHDLKSTDKKARAKTVRIIHGKVRGHPMATRYPDLIPLAAELARTLADPEARCVCVSLLTDITPDGPVPEWMLTALNDPHDWVVHTALSAVYYFKGPELVSPVIKILSRNADMHLTQAAAGALSEIGDPLAIPALAALLERDPSFAIPISEHPLQQLMEQYFSRIAVDLAKFGPSAVAHLTPLLLHTDRNRRIAAIVSLRALGDPACRAAMVALKSDPDPGVRHQAEICDCIWGNFPGFEFHTPQRFSPRTH